MVERKKFLAIAFCEKHELSQKIENQLYDLLSIFEARIRKEIDDKEG